MKSGAWDASSANFAWDNLDSYSTVLTMSTYEFRPNPNAPELYTLCDGVPRAKGAQSITIPSTYISTLTNWFPTATFTEAAPTCAVDSRDCNELMAMSNLPLPYGGLWCDAADQLDCQVRIHLPIHNVIGVLAYAHL